LTKATKEKKIPMTINISAMSKEGNHDVITYSWQDQAIGKKQKAFMRSKGDYSYIQKGLFQKVYTVDKDDNRVAVMQVQETKGKVYKNYVYKAINAWGDSFKAQEFYLEGKESVLDNGYRKVVEVEDHVIAAIMGQNPEEAISEDGNKITTTTEAALLEEPDMTFGLTKEDFEGRFGTPETVVRTAVPHSELVDGDVVYDKHDTRFIFRGLREEGKVGAGSPRLEDKTGSIVIPGKNVELYRTPKEGGDQNNPPGVPPIGKSPKTC